MSMRKGQMVEFFPGASVEWGNPAVITSLADSDGSEGTTLNCTVFIDKNGDTTGYDPAEVDVGIAYRDSVTVFVRGAHIPSGGRVVAFAD